MWRSESFQCRHGSCLNRSRTTYRESVLPSSVRARVAIEAGARIGWERYTGLDGAIIGMDGYGASAPGATNMKEFGFTAENVAETGRRVLEDRI